MDKTLSEKLAFIATNAGDQYLVIDHSPNDGWSINAGDPYRDMCCATFHGDFANQVEHATLESAVDEVFEAIMRKTINDRLNGIGVCDDQ